MRKINLLIILMLAISCGQISNKDKSNNLIKEVKIEKVEFVENENFENFYKIFLKDSVLQLSRINFPLKGSSTEYVFNENQMKDTICETFTIKNKSFFWNKKGWVSFKGEPNLNEFSKEVVTNKNSRSIKYKSKTEDFIMFLEFEIIHKKWYLTYYSSDIL
jgi:hypothetical protein